MTFNSKQIILIIIFFLMLIATSVCYILGIGPTSDTYSFFFMIFLAIFFIFSILIYMLTEIPQNIKDIMLSLLIVASFMIILDLVENTFKFNANSSIYFIYMLITMLFGLINGILAVIYGAILFLTKAYIFSKPFERYIFYSIVSLVSVVVVGLLVLYEKNLIKRLRNKIATLQHAPVEFSLTTDSRTDAIPYSHIISDDGLKKEKKRLMTILNERLFNIVETIRSTLHPFTVILYLKDDDNGFRGREVLSNSEWINMERS